MKFIQDGLVEMKRKKRTKIRVEEADLFSFPLDAFLQKKERLGNNCEKASQQEISLEQSNRCQKHSTAYVWSITTTQSKIETLSLLAQIILPIF